MSSLFHKSPTLRSSYRHHIPIIPHLAFESLARACTDSSSPLQLEASPKKKERVIACYHRLKKIVFEVEEAKRLVVPDVPFAEWFRGSILRMANVSNPHTQDEVKIPFVFSIPYFLQYYNLYTIFNDNSNNNNDMIFFSNSFFPALHILNHFVFFSYFFLVAGYTYTIVGDR